MISRVADHCFWLGRYIERADSTARVLFTTRNMALDAELTARECWQPLLTVAGEAELFAKLYGDGAVDDDEAVQRFLTWDERNPVSMRNSVAGARENARSIREVISREVWEIVNELMVWVTEKEGRAEYENNRYGFLAELRRYTQLCLGVMRATMLHDAPMDFIWMGVLLERLGQTARMLDVQDQALGRLEPHRVVQTSLWLALLRSCSGFEAFMKRNQGRVTREGIVAFLVLEPQFPRSIHFCARNAFERLCAITPLNQPQLPGSGAVNVLVELRRFLETWTPAELGATPLEPFLARVISETDRACELISKDLLGSAIVSAQSPVGQ